MPNLADPRHLPSGWLFATLADNWVIGVIDRRRALARNTVNLTLVRQLDPAEWSKRFFAIGVRKQDISYDAGVITLADPPRVQGQGFNAIRPALVRVRQVIISLEGVDVGDIMKLRRLHRILTTRLLTAA